MSRPLVTLRELGTYITNSNYSQDLKDKLVNTTGMPTTIAVQMLDEMDEFYPDMYSSIVDKLLAHPLYNILKEDPMNFKEKNVYLTDIEDITILDAILDSQIDKECSQSTTYKLMTMLEPTVRSGALSGDAPHDVATKMVAEIMGKIPKTTWRDTQPLHEKEAALYKAKLKRKIKALKKQADKTQEDIDTLNKYQLEYKDL